MRVGILDSRAAAISQVESSLTGAGHFCRSFQNGRNLIDCLAHETFEMLVLDWTAFKFSSSYILKRVREDTVRYIPVLLISSRHSGEDVVDGLRAGADDYIIDPFIPELFIARVNSILRRVYPLSNVEEYWDYKFRSDLRTIEYQGSLIKMTAKEFAIALILFRNMNNTVSRSFLYSKVWCRVNDITARTVDVHVSIIRKKLNLYPTNGYNLIAIYSSGYKLVQILPIKDK